MTRWTLVDAWTMTLRAFWQWARQPGAVAVLLLFPVLMIVIFGSLLGGQMEVPPGADYYDLLVPGMLALAVAFGVEATMMAVVTDAQKGVTDRFRSMPIAPSAVVAGRAVADVLQSLAGVLILVLAGLALGWRWHEGLANAVAALGLLLLLRLAFVWLGVYLGLVAGSPEAVVAVQILVWPIGFLSNVFVSTESMPAVLGTIADYNPLSATAAAVRDLLGNPGWEGTSWAAEHALLLAVLWPIGLVAVFLPLSVRRYQALRR